MRLILISVKLGLRVLGVSFEIAIEVVEIVVGDAVQIVIEIVIRIVFDGGL